MKQKNLLTVLLFCLIAGLAMADEVISVDLNAYGDDTAYSGEAAIPGETVWRAYYGGWGVPVGSARTNGLVNYDDPNQASTYAAQVWIGDDGDYHGYVAGSALMDDGFDANQLPSIPHISLIGLASDPCLGGGAYQGVFDIYVYGSGNFTVQTSGDYGSVNKTATGGFSGTFVENVNYVVFTGVPVNDSNEASIEYDGVINGLQIVKPSSPIEMQSSGTLNVAADDWDVAYDLNNRAGETSVFGPDAGGGEVFYLDAGEYMVYDVNTNATTAGEYRVRGWVYSAAGEACLLNIFVDDLDFGTLNLSAQTSEYELPTDDWVKFNLFEGQHEFKWVIGNEIYFNINSFDFERIGDINMPDCNAVYKYGYQYATDYSGDCSVDAEDLAYIVDGWVQCYSPDVNECP